MENLIIDYNDVLVKKVCFGCLVRPACTSLCRKFLRSFWPLIVTNYKMKGSSINLEDWKKWWFSEVSSYHIQWSRTTKVNKE